MKKRIVAVLTLVSIIGVSVMGCGSKDQGISNDYIKISQYKDLKVAKVDTAKVTDEEVDSQIASVLQQNSTTLDITDRAVENGDTAVIDFVGSHDGVEFEGGSGTDYSLTIGSGNFIEGFEEGVIGHSTGDNFDLNLTFPEVYENNPDLAGQEVVFNVTVKSIQQQQIPELSDEFVQTVSEESKTVDEYKEEVKKSLGEQYKDNAKATLATEVWDTLLANTEVKKYPDDKLDKVEKQMKEQYEQMAGYYNVEFDEFLTTYMNMTAEDFEEQIKGAAEESVKRELAIELIVETEKLSPSEKELTKKYEELAKQYGYEDVSALEDAVEDKDVLESIVLQEIVENWLVENCKQVEESELEKEKEDEEKKEASSESDKKDETSDDKKDDTAAEKDDTASDDKADENADSEE